jgi:hypothetical protein
MSSDGCRTDADAAAVDHETTHGAADAVLFI